MGKRIITGRIGRIVFYGLALAVAAGILFVSTSTIDELYYAEFNVQGRILDEGGNPLAGVRVLLAIDEWRATDKNEQEGIFERQDMMRDSGQFPGNFGLSDQWGRFTARAAAKYGRRSLPLPRFLRKSRHPFEKAWLVIAGEGDMSRVVELDSSNWKPGRMEDEGAMITLDDVTMHQGGEK